MTPYNSFIIIIIVVIIIINSTVFWPLKPPLILYIRHKDRRTDRYFIVVVCHTRKCAYYHYVFNIYYYKAIIPFYDENVRAQKTTLTNISLRVSMNAMNRTAILNLKIVCGRRVDGPRTLYSIFFIYPQFDYRRVRFYILISHTKCLHVHAYVWGNLNIL